MIEAIKEVLKGIDQTEIESSDGWWETSIGAKFGAEALKQVVEALAQHDSVQAKPEPEQEPVATVTSESGNADVKMSWWHEPALPVGTKLYTTPPQRTWVGLTDEQIEQLEQDTCAMEFPETVRAIEAKLKQKNGYAEENT